MKLQHCEHRKLKITETVTTQSATVVRLLKEEANKDWEDSRLSVQYINNKTVP